MKITIIGAGNIGGAIARGLVRGGVFNASDITCTDLMQANLDRLLSADACFNVSQDNPTAIQGADLVVIAVKTWRVEAVIDEIRGTLDYERQSVVSVRDSFRAVIALFYERCRGSACLIPGDSEYRYRGFQ